MLLLSKHTNTQFHFFPLVHFARIRVSGKPNHRAHSNHVFYVFASFIFIISILPSLIFYFTCNSQRLSSRTYRNAHTNVRIYRTSLCLCLIKTNLNATYLALRARSGWSEHVVTNACTFLFALKLKVNLTLEESTVVPPFIYLHSIRLLLRN